MKSLKAEIKIHCLGGIELEKLKLFCLPFAGGSAMAYMSWRKQLDKRIDLKPIELSGRGKRFGEPLYHSIDEVIEDIYVQISDELYGTSYAVFGHSMGAILAYELIRKIIHHTKQEPIHVFLSGRYPPYIEAEEKNVYLLPDKEFIDSIIELGGTNKEVVNNKELLDLFLPILRSDYKLVETYKHSGSILSLNCDITVLNGKYDNCIIGKDINRWREYTNKTCSFYEFEDGHFFINKFKEDVIGIINSELLMDKAISKK